MFLSSKYKSHARLIDAIIARTFWCTGIEMFAKLESSTDAMVDVDVLTDVIVIADATDTSAQKVMRYLIF